MLPLLVLAVAATAIALERAWTLRASEVIPRGIVQEIEHWSRGKTLESSEIQRLRQDSPLGELLAAALLDRHKPREVLKEQLRIEPVYEAKGRPTKRDRRHITDFNEGH